LRRYLDTSVIVSFVINEIQTQAVRDWLAGSSAESNVVSEWTITEFHSALSLKLRTGQISPAIKIEAEGFLKRAAETLFEVVPVLRADFRRSADLASQPDLWLRAGDALNLAIAVRAGDALFTLDRRLFAAAEKVGMQAFIP
jgi:predicted nucleic acid-binding protein